MNKPQTESLSSVEDQLAELYGRINYERQLKVTPGHFKLQNMREILKRLDAPHLKYPVIHVAGTKGKGSTCTMIGQILTASGRKTGVYTSPHLETIHQRMVIDGSLISDAELAETLKTLKPVIEAMDAQAEIKGHRPLTFFEITTAAALLHFGNQNCDVVVLEVGLGGRLDSTNVCEPATCVITNISIDHTRQLGSTVDKIAFEKAGIIKDSVPVVSGAIVPDAAKVIAEVAAQNNAPLFVLDQDFEISAEENQTFDFSARMPLNQEAVRKLESSATDENSFLGEMGFAQLKLGLLGHHQRVNAAVSIATIQTLNQRGWQVSEDAIRLGLQRASLCGRTEVVSLSPTIVIDMAHNAASVEALVETLQHDLPKWKSSAKKTLIVALSREKDAEKILDPLVGAFDQIILTKFQDNPRGRDEAELFKIANAIGDKLRSESLPAADLITAPNPHLAWEMASENLRADQSVCVTGSAFLVAELRKVILGWVE